MLDATTVSLSADALIGEPPEPVRRYCPRTPERDSDPVRRPAVDDRQDQGWVLAPVHRCAGLRRALV